MERINTLLLFGLFILLGYDVIQNTNSTSNDTNAYLITAEPIQSTPVQSNAVQQNLTEKLNNIEERLKDIQIYLQENSVATTNKSTEKLNFQQETSEQLDIDMQVRDIVQGKISNGYLSTEDLLEIHQQLSRVSPEIHRESMKKIVRAINEQRLKIAPDATL